MEASQVAKPDLILNVDDREHQRYTRDRILRSNGFDVANAGTAQEAVRLARSLHPQLILLDVHLPDADGRDLCMRIKADAELASIHIVLISSTLTSNADQVESVHWTGCEGFISEPIDPPSLISTLRKVISDPAGRKGPDEGPA